MVCPFRSLMVLPALLILPLLPLASQSAQTRSLMVVPTVAYLSFGDYFTGPRGVRFPTRTAPGTGLSFQSDFGKPERAFWTASASGSSTPGHECLVIASAAALTTFSLSCFWAKATNVAESTTTGEP